MFGTLILLAGLIVVLVGYATPTRIEAFGGEDLLFVDRYQNNTDYHEFLVKDFKRTCLKNFEIVICNLNFNRFESAVMQLKLMKL